MNTITYNFPGVSLLITHYNRSTSLERLLKSFEELNCKFNEIVVSDDGSEKPHLEHLRKLKYSYSFKLIESANNRGLGHNINKGQAEIITPFTLYIQEDFIPKEEFPNSLKNAIKIMNEDEALDLISFYAYLSYPYKKTYKYGFSERIYKPQIRFSNTTKYYLYSDHPHLRRSSFLEKFGPYKEGINGDEMEIQMSLSFIFNGGRSLVYDNHYGLLTQINSSDEPSTAVFRKSIPWKERNTLVVKALRKIYSTYKLLKLEHKLRNFKA